MAHLPGTWYLAPANDRNDEFAAGYDSNAFASREEAEAEIAGLRSVSGGEWVAVQRAPTCECGRVTGHRCDWQGEVGELVTIEWMPIGLRASHAAAGNSGRWPHNGADRLRVSRECADSLVAGNDGWASEVRPVGAEARCAKWVAGESADGPSDDEAGE